MAQFRRFWFTSVVGALVAVVLAGGVVSAASVESRSTPADGSVRAAGDVVSLLSQDQSVVPSTAIPNPPTTVVAAPATSGPTIPRPSVTVTTLPAPATSVTPASVGPAIRSTRSSYGSYPPGTVEVPFSPGQTMWSGVSNGITITVRSDVARPRAGEIIRFDVELSSSIQPCCGFRILNGDGGEYNVQNVERCSKPVGGTSRHETRHAYNLDGRWTFNVSAFAGDCSGGSTKRIGELFGTIEVVPGVTTAQGPFPPRVLVGNTVQPVGHENDYSWVSIAGYVEDVDGWLRRTVVDWGDGSPPTIISQNPGLTCRAHSVSGWPAASRMGIATGSVFHHYATSGTYTVSIVGVSTACDDTSEAQQGATTFRWQVP